jgi:hypothetical protein
MNSLGLYTGLDMRNQSIEFMQTNFGKRCRVSREMLEPWHFIRTEIPLPATSAKQR